MTTTRIDAAIAVRKTSHAHGRIALACAIVVSVPIAAPLFLSGIQLPAACALALGVGNVIAQSSKAPAMAIQKVAHPLGLLLVAMIAIEFLTTGEHSGRQFDLIAVSVLVPLSYRFGVLLQKEPGGVRVFLTIFVYTCLLSCAIAIYERQSGHYIFSGFNEEVLLREAAADGNLRGRGFLPHPLILALFACVAIPLASTRIFSTNRGTRTVVIGGLLCGALATDSQTVIPVLLGAGLAVACWTFATRARSRFLFAASLMTMACVTVLPVALSALSADSSLVTSSDSNEASSEFRAELFRQAPPLLVANPLGTGFGAVPSHHLVVETPFGPIDGSRTIDSEYVLSIVKFGWLGLAFWSIVLFKTGRCLGRATYCWDMAALIVLGFGSVVALQSWIAVTGLLPIVFAIQWLHAAPRNGVGPAKIQTGGTARR